MDQASQNHTLLHLKLPYGGVNLARFEKLLEDSFACDRNSDQQSAGRSQVRVGAMRTDSALAMGIDCCAGSNPNMYPQATLTNQHK